jgi:hypothetical protein
MEASLLKPEDCRAFGAVALQERVLLRGRFDALVADFASIARGEGTADALLAYQM